MARMKEDELGLNHLTTALSAWPYVISDNEALLRCKQQRIHNASFGFSISQRKARLFENVLSLREIGSSKTTILNLPQT